MVTSTFTTPFRPNPNWYGKFQPSSEIKREIAVLHRLDNWHGILQVMEDWLLIFGSIFLSLSTWHYLPSAIAWMVYFLAILIIGGRMRGLRVNNHQGTHHALAKNKHLNYLLAAPLGSWLVLESFSGYDDTHNSKNHGHHHQLGTEKDVDHRAVVAQGLYDVSCTNNTVKRFLLTLPLQTLSYLRFLIQNRIWNPQENPVERIARLTMLTVILSSIVALGWGQELVLYWFIPLLTTANWLGSVIQLAEHYPLMKMDYPLDIYYSRNRLLNPLWNIIIGVHSDGYHQIHHLYPCLPFWNMKKAHHILLQDELYASLNQEKGIVAMFKQVIGLNQVCQS